MNVSDWGILATIQSMWQGPSQPDVPLEDDYEVLEQEEEHTAAWFSQPTYNHPLPSFKNHAKKRKPKLNKQQKKSRRHIRAMWP